jgi:branched-chain amino acid transport system permease protein
MTYWLSQILNGLSFGMLLYLLATGLTLTLGVMKIVNLAHGSFYLAAGYLGYRVVESTGSFALALVAGIAAALVLGAIVYALLTLVEVDPLRQTLLTFGVIFVIADLFLLSGGGDIYVIQAPDAISGTLQVGDFSYPRYRVFLLLVGVIIAIVLEVIERRTLLGALVRAAIDDPQMAGGVGLNTRTIGTGAFLVGAALAGLGGGLGGALVGTYPNVDIVVLLLALIVVIVGGMGSLTGSLIGALLVGLTDAIGRALVPQAGASLMFALMLIVLAVRPSGLFGRKATT